QRPQRFDLRSLGARWLPADTVRCLVGRRACLVGPLAVMFTGGGGASPDTCCAPTRAEKPGALGQIHRVPACYTDSARMTTPLPLGKLRASLLGELLTRNTGTDPRVVVGPRVGEDAAVLDMGDRYLVATMDPITFVTEDLGWYALVVNANDLAVRG